MARPAACWRLLAFVHLVLSTLALGSCWIDGASRDFCCDLQHGPEGNRACWDEIFQFQTCCSYEGSTPPPASAYGETSGIDAAFLEQMLGPKLDLALADAGEASLEQSLRASVQSPENRTMAARTSRLFLAVLLRRLGREAEAEAHLLKVAVDQDLSISSTGVWVGTNAAGYHMHDPQFAAALVDFFHSRGGRTVGDFGCGLGLYVRDFRAAGFRAGGFDGNPATAEITEGRCQQADLSLDLDFGTQWDWLLSLEVAEHIPPEFEAAFVRNLHLHARQGIVLSWANQAGEGHVNLKTRQEVAKLFAPLGFHSVEASADILRQAATLPWLQNTVLVLEREDRSSAARPRHEDGKG